MKEAKALQQGHQPAAMPASARQEARPESERDTPASVFRRLQRTHGNTWVQRLLAPTYRKACSCDSPSGEGGTCPACAGDQAVQRAATDEQGQSSVPGIVYDVLQTQGTPLDQRTRAFMEPRFGRSLGDVRVHTDSRASDSAKAVSALAYTVGQHMVFREGLYQPDTREGQKLLAHELTHTIQQGPATGREIGGVSQPGDPHEQEAEQASEQIMQMRDDHPHAESLEAGVAGGSDAQDPLSRASSLQRQDSEADGGGDSGSGEEGIEVGGDLRLFPTWSVQTLPHSEVAGSPRGALAGPQLQRADDCDTPGSFRKVTSGKFEGGKTLDDYFPDIVGTKSWGSKDTAGPFDNGFRAGSALQFIATYQMLCVAGGSAYTFDQQIAIARMRGDGKKLMENGKALEGQTINDVARSGRDQSKAPFRQEWLNVISMADPISGAPYTSFNDYEFEATATTKVTGAGGSLSVTWTVKVESKAKKITTNTLT